MRTRPRQATVPRPCAVADRLTPRGEFPTHRLREMPRAATADPPGDGGLTPCPVWGCGSLLKRAPHATTAGRSAEKPSKGGGRSRVLRSSSGAPPRGRISRPPAVAPRQARLLAVRPGARRDHSPGALPHPSHVRARPRTRTGGGPRVCPSRPPAPGLAAEKTGSASAAGCVGEKYPGIGTKTKSRMRANDCQCDSARGGIGRTFVDARNLRRLSPFLLSFSPAWCTLSGGKPINLPLSVPACTSVSAHPAARVRLGRGVGRVARQENYEPPAAVIALCGGVVYNTANSGVTRLAAA